ncbi:hypothetical protein BK672_28215 [Pseudomonas fluorescens]|uniref:Uncharacterized protein n=1 Tax=Pseudomonas fluorescens TaxID=294 RepID=A0A423MS26_PSEFL|nr:hypothetical protein BK672_28215 [Pseudomonas fluorescens]
MLAFLDGALAVGTIAFSIGHGTDSLGGGCLELEGQAVITSVEAAGDLGGVGDLGAYPLLRVLPLAVSLLQRLTFPDAEK